MPLIIPLVRIFTSFFPTCTHSTVFPLLLLLLYSFPSPPPLYLLLFQCSHSTKEVLDKAIHSLDLPELCLPGHPKTSPLGQEALGSGEAPAKGSCPPLGRRSRRSSSSRDSLHSFNPAFRLAAPSPALGRPLSAVGHVPQSEHTPHVDFVPVVNFTPGVDLVPLS